MSKDIQSSTSGTPRARRQWPSVGTIVIGIIGVIVLLVGLSGGQYEGKMSQVEKNDNSAFLPASAESTKVNDQAQLFQTVQSMPGFIVYQRTSGLTPADRRSISFEANAFRRINGVASNQVGAPQYSADGTTAAVSVPLVAQRGTVSVSGDEMKDVETLILKDARAGVPPGLVVHSAGPAGLLVALIGSFSGIDGALLFAALLVVILILLLVYRSPYLWFFPLLGSVVALGAASLVVYQLGKHDVLTLNGQSTGILSVLVLGAGTDYALLLTSRYREELHNHDSRLAAMTAAWRRAATPIAVSGATVILALLTLSFGQLNSDRSLGPVCAIGIACAVVSMLTFLPLALTVMSRKVFWPRIPLADHQSSLSTHGFWGSISGFVGRHSRRAWVVTSVVLGICAIGVGALSANGLSMSQGFTNQPDAVLGQAIFDSHFANGAGAPTQITANVAEVPAVIAAAARVPGVATAPGSVCVEPNYAKLASLGTESRHSGVGCLPSILSVAPEHGRLLIDVTLTSSYDTQQAYNTVVRLRAVVHAIPGAAALVGGPAAVNYDTNQAARHDRNLIIPIVLVVILVVLMLLLRAMVAPILLVASVVLSFLATLGISAFFFRHVFHFAGADPGLPLFVFIFLVALGVDYNIFLMTRVREETLSYGTRQGILRGLSLTGGVITSAGVVLASTFAVLTVIPLVFLAELGFAVALGVLLDTMIVRSILIPALNYDIGGWIWWPSRLRSSDNATQPTSHEEARSSE